MSFEEQRVVEWFVAVDEDELDGEIAGGFAGEREAVAISKEKDGVGVEQQLADLIGVKGGVERDGCVSRGEHAEIGGHPQGMIGGEEGALGAAFDA